MLTFSLLGTSGLRITGAARPFTAFAEGTPDSELSLHAVPEDHPSADNISWPGEYDRAGITIRGIGQEEGKKVSYTVEADGYRIAFVSSPLQAFSDEDLERFGEVQVLVIPAENAKLCQKIMEDIDPQILILTPTPDGSLNQDTLKSCGAATVEHVQEFKLKGALPAEGRETVVLNA